MTSVSWRVTEYDEADNLTVTYVSSLGDADNLSRVDTIPPQDSKSSWQKFLDVFLPVGYPHSVTSDYLEYQIYDSLQAFSSSIAGLLSSRAVLSSVGVGDSTASPTAALLLTIVQESLGRIATILFAHRLGTALEPECKMYRLLADVLNDTAFILDCLSPIFVNKTVRVIVLSFSSVLRALCGVAAGSAKASLSAHFARWGNLGELNAKDSSQETVISLMGMLAGSFVVSWITTPTATWTALILLLSIHLETNRRAVRAVCMRTLNRQRATIVFHHLRQGHVPSPQEVAQQERIFERDGVLRRNDDSIAGYCAIGVPLSRLLRALASSQDSSTKRVHLDGKRLQQVVESFRQSPYILWPDRSSHESTSLFVVLKKSANNLDILTAWWQALALLNTDVEKGNKFVQPSVPADIKAIEQSAKIAIELLHDYRERLENKGWALSSNALETTSTTRIVVDQS